MARQGRETTKHEYKPDQRDVSKSIFEGIKRFPGAEQAIRHPA